MKVRIFNFHYVMIVLAGMLAFSTVCHSRAFEDLGRDMDDAAITSEITLNFAKDISVSPLTVKVSTNAGVVTLIGEVESKTQYKGAIKIAESTEGVVDVDADGLTVKESESAINDMYITGKIQGLIIKHEFTSPEDIEYWSTHVETNDGIVFLTGEVDDIDKIKTLTDIAYSVEGVKAVRVNIKVIQ